MEYKEIFVSNVCSFFNFASGGLYYDPDSIQYSSGNFCLRDDILIIYLSGGKLHRDDGPAIICRHKQNVRGREKQSLEFQFYRDGVSHDEFVPAYYSFQLFGGEFVLEKSIYYLNDRPLSESEWLRQIQTKLYW